MRLALINDLVQRAQILDAKYQAVNAKFLDEHGSVFDHKMEEYEVATELLDMEAREIVKLLASTDDVAGNGTVAAGK